MLVWYEARPLDLLFSKREFLKVVLAERLHARCVKGHAWAARDDLVRIFPKLQRDGHFAFKESH